jgi:ADP-heptose:LPS heptosyltransferase
MKTGLNKEFFLVFKTYYTKFINIFRYLIYLILDFIISRSPQIRTTGSLLLIRLDSIGDYILVRNFFSAFKQSKRYQDYTITLCGNVIWKDLAEFFDAKIIDNFIWLDRKRFNNNPFYKYKILKYIYKRGFETVIDTTFSRENLFGDSIVKTNRAIERIGSSGSPDAYAKWKRNLLTNKYYSKIIPYSDSNIFEFYRNKEFFEKILLQSIEIIKPILDVTSIACEIPTNNDFIVIFPGAQEPKRRWAAYNFGFVVQTISKKFGYDIIIAGSKADTAIAKKLYFYFNAKKVYDMTGKTTLPQLAKLISLSKILISNETGAVHIAAAVGTPFVCISNGNHFGRFHPYPKEVFDKAFYIYPPEIMNNLNNEEMLKEKYRFNSDLNINGIKPEAVEALIKSILE